MGGTGIHDMRNPLVYDSWNLDQKDVAEFISTGYKGADILTRGLKTQMRFNEDTGQKTDTMHYFDSANNEVNARQAVDAFAAFSEYKKKRDELKANSDKWAQELAAAPGRDATIIGYHAPKATVIG
jgi:hypothetical protein